MTSNNFNGGTKYINFRRCLNCYSFTAADRNKCTNCNCLFIGLASDIEKAQAEEKLIKMQDGTLKREAQKVNKTISKGDIIDDFDYGFN